MCFEHVSHVLKRTPLFTISSWVRGGRTCHERPLHSGTDGALGRKSGLDSVPLTLVACELVVFGAPRDLILLTQLWPFDFLSPPWILCCCFSAELSLLLMFCSVLRVGGFSLARWAALRLTRTRSPGMVIPVLSLEALERSFQFSADMGSQVDRSAAVCSDERETHHCWISVVSWSCTLVRRKRLGDSEEHRIQQRARSAAKQQQRSRATTHGVLATAEAF